METGSRTFRHLANMYYMLDTARFVEIHCFWATVGEGSGYPAQLVCDALAIARSDPSSRRRIPNDRAWFGQALGPRITCRGRRQLDRGCTMPEVMNHFMFTPGPRPGGASSGAQLDINLVTYSDQSVVWFSSFCWFRNRDVGSAARASSLRTNTRLGVYIHTYGMKLCLRILVVN